MSRLLLSAAAALLLAAAAHARGNIEMSSSAIVFYNSDFKPGTYWDKDLCSILMERAAKHGGKAVQLVPTMYWCVSAPILQPGLPCEHQVARGPNRQCAP